MNQETEIALLKKDLAALTAQLADNQSAITALQDERNQALRWGLMSLGAAVLGLSSWIFNQITGGHLK